MDPVRFPIIPGIKSAAGIIRIFAKKIHPEFEIYVSPVNMDPGDPELPISTPSVLQPGTRGRDRPFLHARNRRGHRRIATARPLPRRVSPSRAATSRENSSRCWSASWPGLPSGLLFIHFLGIDQDLPPPVGQVRRRTPDHLPTGRRRSRPSHRKSRRRVAVGNFRSWFFPLRARGKREHVAEARRFASRSTTRRIITRTRCSANVDWSKPAPMQSD